MNVILRCINIDIENFTIDYFLIAREIAECNVNWSNEVFYWNFNVDGYF